MLGLIENQCRQLDREATPPLRKGRGSKAHLAWLLTPTKKRQLKINWRFACYLDVYFAGLRPASTSRISCSLSVPTAWRS